jgi:hypothetical protein
LLKIAAEIALPHFPPGIRMPQIPPGGRRAQP